MMGLEWTPIILAIIAVMVPGFGTWLTYRANATHTAVNSERTKTTAEIQRLNDTIAQMVAQFAEAQKPKPPIKPPVRARSR